MDTMYASAVSEFVEKTRAHVQKNGGFGDYFTTISASLAPFEIFVDYEYGDLLLQLIEDSDFYERFLDNCANSDQRTFIEIFIKGWRFYRDLDPDGYGWARIVMANDLWAKLREGIPARVNDIAAAVSNISVESMGETVRVQCAAKLYMQNKTLGGDDIFIMSANLPNFLRSIYYLIESLKLSKEDASAVKIVNSIRIRLLNVATKYLTTLRLR